MPSPAEIEAAHDAISETAQRRGWTQVNDTVAGVLARDALTAAEAVREKQRNEGGPEPTKT